MHHAARATRHAEAACAVAQRKRRAVERGGRACWCGHQRQRLLHAHLHLSGGWGQGNGGAGAGGYEMAAAAVGWEVRHARCCCAGQSGQRVRGEEPEDRETRKPHVGGHSSPQSADAGAETGADAGADAGTDAGYVPPVRHFAAGPLRYVPLRLAMPGGQGGVPFPLRGAAGRAAEHLRGRALTGQAPGQPLMRTGGGVRVRPRQGRGWAAHPAHRHCRRGVGAALAGLQL
mmetsp:Transcript_32246/g.71707  ORF Transcript_32246/g.71707 Transcript_32246/m.71707 type:complete len:231 (+) Transcript_32246:1525-2217(+)